MKPNFKVNDKAPEAVIILYIVAIHFLNVKKANTCVKIVPGSVSTLHEDENSYHQRRGDHCNAHYCWTSD